jgi:hypothetical protein
MVEDRLGKTRSAAVAARHRKTGEGGAPGATGAAPFPRGPWPPNSDFLAKEGGSATFKGRGVIAQTNIKKRCHRSMKALQQIVRLAETRESLLALRFQERQYCRASLACAAPAAVSSAA